MDGKAKQFPPVSFFAEKVYIPQASVVFQEKCWNMISTVIG